LKRAAGSRGVATLADLSRLTERDERLEEFFDALDARAREGACELLRGERLADGALFTTN
jgi:hypothetical protein